MRKLKALICSILLITTPALCAYPSHPIASHSEVSHQMTYDEILDLLDQLESGYLEENGTPEDLDRVNYLLASLAQQGVLPNDYLAEIALQADIEDLLGDTQFEWASAEGDITDFQIIPAIINGPSEHDLIITRGWLSKKWSKTKKFAKDHKKEIIIGAAIVVAVAAVVVVTVAVSASAGAAVAGAAGTAGAGSSTREERKEPSSVTAMSDAPILKETIDQHVVPFKEFIQEDLAASPGMANDPCFREKAREFGAYLAHEAYKEVTDLVGVVPELFEEIKAIGPQLLPGSLTLPDSGPSISPFDKYENLVAGGHKAIDSLFSTDQSECFTAKANPTALSNEFALGLIPLPNGVPKIFSNSTKILRAGEVIDRGGFTKAGRGIMKHGYREPSNFTKPLGNPSQVNAQGQKVLESIVNHPERTYVIHQTRRLGKTVDIFAPNIGGVRYSLEGDFIGFLEF